MVWGFFAACKVIVLTDAKGMFSQMYGLKKLQSKRKIQNVTLHITFQFPYSITRFI